MTTELPKGFECSACRAKITFSSYVYAHWDEMLVHTCTCGKKHEIVRGLATPVVERAGKRLTE